MDEIFRRFYENFTHHPRTKQREDVEGKNWVKPLLCLQRILPLSSFDRCLSGNFADFGILFEIFVPISEGSLEPKLGSLKRHVCFK